MAQFPPPDIVLRVKPAFARFAQQVAPLGFDINEVARFILHHGLEPISPRDRPAAPRD